MNNQNEFGIKTGPAGFDMNSAQNQAAKANLFASTPGLTAADRAQQPALQQTAANKMAALPADTPTVARSPLGMGSGTLSVMASPKNITGMQAPAETLRPTAPAGFGGPTTELGMNLGRAPAGWAPQPRQELPSIWGEPEKPKLQPRPVADAPRSFVDTNSISTPASSLQTDFFSNDLLSDWR